MRRILTVFIIVYWAAFFCLIAAISTLDPQRGVLTAFDLIGASPDAANLPGPALSALFSLVLAVVGVIFLWTLVAIVIGGTGDETELTAIAFGSAAGALAVLLAMGLLMPIEDAARALAFQMAALTASYLAIQVERRPRIVAELVDRHSSPVKVLPFMAGQRPHSDAGEIG